MPERVSTGKAAQLPPGMTPRLLSRVRAAAYCGLSPNAFDEHVAPIVQPIEFGRRNLWDVKALDRWLDRESGLAHATVPQSIEERLNGGDQGARR
jgi:hypothetical protein